jgi:Bacterial SH3 domain
MAFKQYRCIVGALTIRTQPQASDQFKTGQQLKLNELIGVDPDTRTENSGFVWLQHDRGWSAERSIDGKLVYLLDAALRPRERMWGINIDPYNPTGNPSAARLAGLGWVRFVFHVSSKGQTLDQAFSFYDPIIRAHVQSGTSVLLILIHDTYMGNAPWRNGDWETYIRGYAETVAKIAGHYRGLVAAYEIWNEQDQPPDRQEVPTSVFVPPQKYGLMLLATAQAVKQADPAAKVITGGLVSGEALSYMAKAQASIGGTLPVDGIAIHPYGLTPPDATPFANWSQGGLGPALARTASAFPRMPIWITEIGVPGVDVTKRAYWPGIANYMSKTFALVRNNFFHVVPALIWFAWSDSMDRAGIVNDDQQPKGVIFSTFFDNLRSDRPEILRLLPTPYDGKVMLTHVSGQLVGEQSIAELAQRINLSAPNARAVLVKSSVGASWQGQNDNKRSMAINGPADLARWTAELARYRIDLHVWHEVWGGNIAAEIAVIAQAAQAPGVMSLVLDLDPARLVLRTSDEIRSYMVGLRQALPGNYHIGLSFDGRPDYFKFVNLLEWFPFINSWHPKIFHWQYSGGQYGPASYLVAMSNGLRNYHKPIVPMLQAEPSNGRGVPPEQIRQAARLAFETYNVPAVSFWRLGAIGPQEFTAIQAAYVPWTAGTVAAPPAPDTLVTQTTGPLRIRSKPSLDAPVVGFLQPGEQITVLERAVIGSLVWVRYDRGWSVSRNGPTGETYLG